MVKGGIVVRTPVLVLLAFLVFAVYPISCAAASGDRTETGDHQSMDSLRPDEFSELHQEKQEADGEPIIRFPDGFDTDTGQRDSELEAKPLPQTDTTLGVPRAATGGGFPDPSMRTGTFGINRDVPGAGGTRAGR
jgi:hypothetical protein